ncbi:MAG: heavy metal resistance protein CzcA [Alphaproteobacteria bacterium]|nr:MAG: heavy metal resistance protein CzcA [Alphaproteobacteria bacterium]
MIEACLKNKVAANLFAIVIIATGLMSMQGLNMRLFPQITLQAISITVPFPGATPNEVEKSILKPIEERLEGMEGVRRITGLAASNVASVIVDLEEGESIPDMLDDIQTEINRITVFPKNAERPQVVHVQMDELAARIVLYGDRDAQTLKALAERVRTELAGRSGVSRVTISGAPEYLIDITVSNDTLQSLGISLVDIANRLSEQSLDLSGGNIEGDRQKLLIRSTGERRSEDEFRSIVLGTSASGRPILLGDIADVSDGLADSPIRAVFNGQPATFITISRVGDEKLLDLTASVRDYFDNHIKAALPEGVKAVMWRDESVMLSGRIDLLTKNAVVGLILVSLLLMAFLDIRIAAWVAFGVGVSFVGAFTAMSLFDITINQLTLFGFILAIGIVVDDAIVVGENIHSVRKSENVSAMEAARLGVLRVSTPVLFSVFTTIVAFVPLLLLPGTFGQFLGPIAAVVIFVLAISLFESFFILPRHLAHLRDGPPRWFSPRRFADPFRDKFAAGLRRLTEGPVRRGITFSVHNPMVTIMVAFGLFFGAMSLISSGYVKFIFFPNVEGDYVTVELELTESSSQDQTIIYAERIAAAATETAKLFSSKTKPVEGVFWTLGVSLALDDGQAKTDGGATSNRAFIMARLEEAGSRSFSAKEFEDAWRDKVGEIPGTQKLTFTSDLISPGAAIQLQISTAHDRDTRAAMAEVRAELEALPGVYDVRDDRFRTTDEVRISIKPLARSYGLTQIDLARQVRAAFFGAEAVRVQRDREEIQVRVRLPHHERNSLDAMRQLRIKVGDGFVPISQLADITIEPSPAAITRIGGRRVFKLTADVDVNLITPGTVTDRMLNDTLPRLRAQFEGLEISLTGDQEEQAKTAPAIAKNFMVAMMVIYTLLALSFMSYSQPLIVMIAIPFGFMGALIGHALMGQDMTLLSMFGVIGLSGVIINNSLIVINFVNDRLSRGEEGTSAVINASIERFRAILLTTLTTFLGVTPIILETSVQAQFLVPTAVSLGFGIIIGTSILIFTLPAITVLHMRIFMRTRARAQGETA